MLALDDIHTYYGDSHTLRGVSLELPAGSSLGLLGRNGMGKTTLIRTLMGFVRAAGGHVRWDGVDVTNAAPARAVITRFSRTDRFGKMPRPSGT